MLKVYKGVGNAVEETLQITAKEAGEIKTIFATFENSKVYQSLRRHQGKLVLQRNDISWSVQNVGMITNVNKKTGRVTPQPPFVKRASTGEYEQIQLHHHLRGEDRPIVEVLAEDNKFNPKTGGRLHLPDRIPGIPPADNSSAAWDTFRETYWQSRLQEALDQGMVPQSVINSMRSRLTAQGYRIP